MKTIKLSIQAVPTGLEVATRTYLGPSESDYVSLIITGCNKLTKSFAYIFSWRPLERSDEFRPCGYKGKPVKPYTSAPAPATKYQKWISGPLLDHSYRSATRQL